MKNHPLAQPTHARIDVCFGGDQESVVKDSLTIMRQAVMYLSHGEHVLYINTLAAHKQIDEVAKAVSIRQAAKVLAFTQYGTELTQRLTMLRTLVEEKNVRVVVMNSLDFATQNSRQRIAIVHWLREMRDELDVRVIVYSLHEPAKFGAMGQLGWIADTVEEVGRWRLESTPEPITERPNANTAIKAMLDEILNSETSEEDTYEFTLDVNRSLITKELTEVAAREDDFAMAT